MIKIIDISASLSDELPIYPGDPQPRYRLVSDMARGDHANVGMLSLCVHHGTHVDVPRHFLADGCTLDQVPMDHWVGNALVADLPHVDHAITARDIESLPLNGVERLLLKTRNSFRDSREACAGGDFIHLAPDACSAIVAAGIRTVGFDWLTVDPYGSPDFPAHHILLSGGVCIIEYLRLAEVPAGEYFLVCLPLKLVGTEGAPARAILLE